MNCIEIHWFLFQSFDKKNEKDNFGVKIPEIPDDDPMDGAANGLQNGDAGDKAKNKKRLSVERIYQKKTQLEHILLRPDTYIGSVESVTQVTFPHKLHSLQACSQVMSLI